MLQSCSDYIQQLLNYIHKIVLIFAMTIFPPITSYKNSLVLHSTIFSYIHKIIIFLYTITIFFQVLQKSLYSIHKFFYTTPTRLFPFLTFNDILPQLQQPTKTALHSQMPLHHTHKITRFRPQSNTCGGAESKLRLWSSLPC